MTRSHWPTVTLAAFAFCSGCGSDPLSDPAQSDGEEPTGTTSAEIEWWRCVDHPCPDLKPRKYSECFRPSGGSSMVVAIENIGTAAAGASKAKFWVDYYGYSRTYDVPYIAAGNRYDLFVALPSSCLTEPGCSWGVLADATNWVSEVNATNNTTRGACIY